MLSQAALVMLKSGAETLFKIVGSLLRRFVAIFFHSLKIYYRQSDEGKFRDFNCLLLVGPLIFIRLLLLFRPSNVALGF